MQIKDGGFRRSDWWGHKLPPLFGVGYLIIGLHGIPFSDVWLTLICLLVWMISAASFGYYLNDFCDIGEDRIAGKKNFASKHRGPTGILILLSSSFIAIAPWWLLINNRYALLLSLGHLALFILYSVPPIRLKHRGVWGPITDALYAHAVPVLVVISAIWPHGVSVTPYYLLLLSLLIMWQGLLGLRSIIEHQIVDFDFDKRAGVTNYVQSIGLRRSGNLVYSVLPSFEIFMLISFIGVLTWSAPILGTMSLIMLLLIYLNKPFGEGILKYHPLKQRVLNYALSQVQEMVIPLVFLVTICFQERIFILVAIIHLIIFLPGHARLIDIGKDHVAKPLYYKGVLWAYYSGKSGVNVSVQGLIKVYARALRPFYYLIESSILWVYYKGLWGVYRLLKWLLYNTVVWFFYNVPFRLVSLVWHWVYFIRHNQWHESYNRNKRNGPTNE